jgi:hypothetical protein
VALEDGTVNLPEPLAHLLLYNTHLATTMIPPQISLLASFLHSLHLHGAVQGFQMNAAVLWNSPAENNFPHWAQQHLQKGVIRLTILALRMELMMMMNAAHMHLHLL